MVCFMEGTPLNNIIKSLMNTVAHKMLSVFVFVQKRYILTVSNFSVSAQEVLNSFNVHKKNLFGIINCSSSSGQKSICSINIMKCVVLPVV